MKFDEEKVRLDLIEPEFITGLGQALTDGVHKYGEDDWKNTKDGLKRYFGAVLRHSMAIRMGEWVDPKSKLPHVYHVAANLMFIDYFYRRDPVETFTYLQRFGSKSYAENRPTTQTYWARLQSYTKRLIKAARSF